MAVQVKVNLVIQEDRHVVLGDIEIVRVPLAEDGMMLNGCTPGNTAVTLVIIKSVVNPSEHFVPLISVPIIATFHIF